MSAFWKPGTNGPGLPTNNSSVNPSSILNSSIKKDRSGLLIDKYKDQILYLVEKHQVLFLCGDSLNVRATQIPFILYNAGWCSEGHVVVSSFHQESLCKDISGRVALELNESIGERAGYSCGLDDKTTRQTCLKFCTHQVLVKELLVDPLLSKYSAIIINGPDSEYLDNDIVLAMLKKILKKRPELRVVLSCITENIGDFMNYFKTDTCAALTLETPTFPVHNYYLTEPCRDYITETINTVFKIHELEGPGDILVLLTGREDVETVVNLITDREVESRTSLLAYPLYGSHLSDRNYEALIPAPPRTRKVIVSTSVCEGFGGIDGVTYVVDSGFSKLRIFNPETCSDQFVVFPVGLKVADRRSTLASFTKPGKCFRLYTENELDSLINLSIPEIQRSDISAALLQLKSLGIGNLLTFDYIRRPNSLILKSGLELLHSMGFVDDTGSITKKGVQAAESPVDDLMITSMLLNSGHYKCSEEILTIASILLTKKIYLPGPSGRYEEAKRKFGVEEGDFIAAVNVYQSFLQARKSASWCQSNFVDFQAITRAVQTRARLMKYLVKIQVPIQSCGNDIDALRKCICLAFYRNAARYNNDGSFTTILGSQIVYIHPHSCLFGKQPPHWIVFSEKDDGVKVYAKNVLTIDPIWLPDMLPNSFQLIGY